MKRSVLQINSQLLTSHYQHARYARHLATGNVHIQPLRQLLLIMCILINYLVKQDTSSSIITGFSKSPAPTLPLQNLLDYNKYEYGTLWTFAIQLSVINARDGLLLGEP